jgi:hypothetical protein
LNDDDGNGVINASDDLDLVVANSGSRMGGDPFGGVAVLLGNGAGAFSLHTVFRHSSETDRLGTTPVSLAMGDYNGDGRSDIAVANFRDNTISLLQGQGNGNFTVSSAGPFAIASGPIDLTAADIDRDNDLDLIISSLGSGTGNISLLRNRTSQQGTGFEPVEVLAVANLNFITPVFFHAVGDMNGDNLVDIVVGDGINNTVKVRANSLINGAYQVLLAGVETISGLNFGLAPNRIAGDFDYSNGVDTLDYGFWRSNFAATSGPGIAADGNGNGVVDAADYVNWRKHDAAAAASPPIAAAFDTSDAAAATADMTTPIIVKDEAFGVFAFDISTEYRPRTNQSVVLLNRPTEPAANTFGRGALLLTAIPAHALSKVDVASESAVSSVKLSANEFNSPLDRVMAEIGDGLLIAVSRPVGAKVRT